MIFRTNPFRDILLERGEGCFLWDTDEKKYLDMEAGIWCCTLGHSHQAINKAIREQLDKIIHTGKDFLSPYVLEAAEKLTFVTPKGLNKVIFLNTGSECVDCAIKIAKAYTQSYELIGFERGYVGATQTSFHVSGFNLRGYSPRVGIHKILQPFCLKCPVRKEYPECEFLCLETSKKLIEANTDKEIAAVVFEPIFASGGIVVPPKEYFLQVKEIAEEFGALMIADEVTTGLGRSGKWFGFQHYNVKPDIVVLSKTLGNGFPVGAVIVSEEIEEELSGNFYHVQSHQFDPLPARVASAVLDVLKRENLIENSEKMGNYLLKKFTKLKEKYNSVVDVRGKGLIMGVEVKSRSEEIFKNCLRKGLIFGYVKDYSLFRFLPPLTITKKEIDFCIEVFEDALRRVEERWWNEK
ncbi:MAG: aspartate aminotransferase family protein [Candidatus Methanofastidiosia archaeon]